MLTSQTLSDVGADVSAAVKRAEAIIAAAEGSRSEARDGHSPRVLRDQLIELGRAIEERLLRAADPEEIAACSDLLISVLALRNELHDHEVRQWGSAVTDIGRALGRLRGQQPQEMIHTTPEVVCDVLDFRRCMISTVRGSVWRPKRLYVQNAHSDPETERFQAYIDGRQLQLADAPLETEVVRKRAGALVSAPHEDHRTFKEIVEASGSWGYIAAPIVAQGRVIGMLHADRPRTDRTVTMHHLESLEAFAECLAIAFESAVMAHRAVQQKREVEQLFAHLENLDGRSAQRQAEAALAPAEAPGGPQPPGPQAPLTAREREIMALVATGATNRQIARNLMISEGTVKTHLKHIAKKLNTSSRAAAVAAYAGLTSGAR